MTLIVNYYNQIGGVKQGRYSLEILSRLIDYLSPHGAVVSSIWWVSDGGGHR